MINRTIFVFNNADSDLTVTTTGDLVRFTDTNATPNLLNSQVDTNTIITDLSSEVDKVAGSTPGVLSVAFTAANNTPYYFELVQQKVDPFEQPSVVPISYNSDATATAAEIAAGILAQVNGYSLSNKLDVTATGSGTPVTLTATSQYPLISTQSPKNVTVSTTTAGVAAFLEGSQAESYLNSTVYASDQRPVPGTYYNVIYLAVELPNGLAYGGEQGLRMEYVFLVDGGIAGTSGAVDDLMTAFGI